MENERTKELAYLFDQDEKEVETLVTEEVKAEAEPETEAEAPAKAKEKKAKSDKKEEKQKKKKRKKEHYPTKTDINLFYKVDKTTGPVTAMLYIMFVLVLLLALGKFGVYDMMQSVTALENELADKETEVQMLMLAAKDYNTVKGEYNRYTQGYLEEDEKPIDRLIILDMLEEKVFARCNAESTSIMDDSIFISYTGLDLEETSALVKELESYKWVKDVAVQTASLSVNESSGFETISTTMIIETYATMEEVPADE